MASKSDKGLNSKEASRRQAHRIIISILLALVLIIVGTFILSYNDSQSNGNIDLSLREVAPADILAPQQFSYISEIRTQEERDQAQAQVAPISTPPDRSVARTQSNRLRKIFDFLEVVRADPYGTLAQKSEWISAIPDLTLSDIVISEILITPDDIWAQTREESMAILNQAMRGEVKVSQVSSIRRQLPTLVALDTPDAQNDIIVDIVGDLIKPNTFPDETRTATEREAAAAAVEPVNVTIEEDELIIAAGRVVDEATLEKLEALQALRGATSSQLQDFVAPVVLMLITTVIIAVSLGQYKPRMLTDVNRLVILTLLLLTFIAFAKLMIPQDSLYQFYPIATLTMLIVFLVNTNLALILAVMVSILAGYIAGARAFEVFLYLILGGWAGAFSMGRSQGIADLRRAGTYIALANLAIFTIFGLPLVIESLPNIDLVMAFSWAINAVISVGLAFVGLLVISSLAGITTSIQLQELGRPTHPLQRELLLKAPGTYHHSLMVGNLGEQAAERIGADALLVRVMAYYHDIGKIQRPYFFVENQPQGINVHEKLDPQISAQIIISHVTDGLKMAKKYGLPPVIQDGIAQHQGTDVVRYFYYQAQKAAEEKDEVVDESEFRYPGPKPQTRETGILMLADICETSVRAMKPGSAEEIDEIVEKMIADKVSSGQLNACDLTIADLHKIRTAFVDILQGVHHPRIKYPEQVKAEEEAARPSAESEQSADPASTTEKRPTPAPASPATGSASSLQNSNSRSKAQPTPLVRRE